MDSTEQIFKRDSFKYLRFDLKYNILFMFIGVLSFFQTVLQIIFSINSNNFIYFAACFLFGPFQLFATLLLLLISEYSVFILFCFNHFFFGSELWLLSFSNHDRRKDYSAKLPSRVAKFFKNISSIYLFSKLVVLKEIFFV
jgi:hypothetical protein